MVQCSTQKACVASNTVCVESSAELVCMLCASGLAPDATGVCQKAEADQAAAAQPVEQPQPEAAKPTELGKEGERQPAQQQGLYPPDNYPLKQEPLQKEQQPVQQQPAAAPDLPLDQGQSELPDSSDPLGSQVEKPVSEEAQRGSPAPSACMLVLWAPAASQDSRRPVR